MMIGWTPPMILMAAAKYINHSWALNKAHFQIYQWSPSARTQLLVGVDFLNCFGFSISNI
jgi:hypothetical protein